VNSGTFSITAVCGRWNSRVYTGAQAVERDASCSGLPDFLPRALAAGRGEQDIVCWNLLPARLVQVLADVLSVGVVGAVPLNGYRPVI
jgi:hypothetical protein